MAFCGIFWWFKVVCLVGCCMLGPFIPSPKTIDHFLSPAPNMNVGGLFMALGGGIMGGLYTAPLYWIEKAWEWENGWFMYSLVGTLILPWALALGLVSDLGAVYSAVDGSTIGVVMGFGAGWGVGSVLFGLGTSTVGNSLGFGIILGLTSTLGSVIPLVVLHPAEVTTPSGYGDLGALGVALLGITGVALAGHWHEQHKQERALDDREQLLMVEDEKEDREEGRGRLPFWMGLVICVLSGVFSPMLNLALAFGSKLEKEAQKRGASPADATNAVWALAVSSGGVVNIAYTLYLLLRKGTWRLFFTPKPSNSTTHSLNDEPGHSALSPLLNSARAIALGCVMGALWYGSVELYGRGSILMGSLGDVVGWPVYLCGMIGSAQIAGFLLGEWNGAPRHALIALAIGLLLLAAAIVLVALASKF